MQSKLIFLIVLILSVYLMFSNTGSTLIKRALGIIKAPTNSGTSDTDNPNETHSGGATPNLDITLTKTPTLPTGVSHL